MIRARTNSDRIHDYSSEIKKRLQGFESNLPELIIENEKYVSKMINDMVK